jgi:hypothetical protein
MLPSSELYRKAFRSDSNIASIGDARRAANGLRFVQRDGSVDLLSGGV